jgi:hypothetical protein
MAGTAHLQIHRLRARLRASAGARRFQLPAAAREEPMTQDFWRHLGVGVATAAATAVVATLGHYD